MLLHADGPLKCSAIKESQWAVAVIATTIVCFTWRYPSEMFESSANIALVKLMKVHELLESLLTNKSAVPISPGGHRELIEFSDVQLLAYLDHFEEKNRGKDKDLEFLLNPRAKDDGGQIDICLVTSTTNTQVTITPAGDKAQDIKPPKVARFISHKPSVEEIRDDYPGVTVLKGVDFSRIPALLLEMQEMMDYKAQKEMDKAGILPTDVQRLEIEAQLLREAEPFYLSQDLKWKLPGHNGNLRVFKQEMCNNIPVPDNVADFISSTKDIYDQLNSKYNINGSSLHSTSKVNLPRDKDILRLLKEAQELGFSGSHSFKS
ncbi:uncharacterized protein LOC134763141 [Penaeus indicus]|uniref:uncharacterized protein LOC134763141 n=1 Tax=Penaeus indicus TaxID=29960 RepID=UPI00300D7996